MSQPEQFSHTKSTKIIEKIAYSIIYKRRVQLLKIKLEYQNKTKQHWGTFLKFWVLRWPERGFRSSRSHMPFKTFLKISEISQEITCAGVTL